MLKSLLNLINLNNNNNNFAVLIFIFAIRVRWIIFIIFYNGSVLFCLKCNKIWARETKCSLLNSCQNGHSKRRQCSIHIKRIVYSLLVYFIFYLVFIRELKMANLAFGWTKWVLQQMKLWKETHYQTKESKIKLTRQCKTMCNTQSPIKVNRFESPPQSYMLCVLRFKKWINEHTFMIIILALWPFV